MVNPEDGFKEAAAVAPGLGSDLGEGFQDGQNLLLLFIGYLNCHRVEQFSCFTLIQPRMKGTSMASFSVLLTAAKTAKTLQSFIDSGGMAVLLAEIHIDAARNSLSKATLANDKRGQVFNAVGQLEVAYCALEIAVKSYTGIQYLSPPALSKVMEAEKQARYVLCIMACCYKYLNEERLCRAHIEKALNSPKLKGNPAVELPSMIAGSFMGFLKLIYLVGRDTITGRKDEEPSIQEISDEDVKELGAALLAH